LTQPASVNGVALHLPGEAPDTGTLRQRACSELLRQAAQEAGLLGIEDSASPDGVLSADASDAIEQLLERELTRAEPDEAACRRHHAAHEATYRQGDRVLLRHILFAVTPGVDVRRLRERAEQVLLEVRCTDAADAQASVDDLFGRRAAELSNCPSAQEGGHLGWVTTPDLAPELARELFSGQEVGVLPRLVHSRFGLHVVEVLRREVGTVAPFESVRAAVRLSLQQQSWATALRQYLQLLAGQAQVVGVQLDAADTPLLQ
jgi:peptidyl-prolyl cis-trans isomerase C